jgi:hypothetical protein
MVAVLLCHCGELEIPVKAIQMVHKPWNSSGPCGQMTKVIHITEPQQQFMGHLFQSPLIEVFHKEVDNDQSTLHNTPKE